MLVLRDNWCQTFLYRDRRGYRRSLSSNREVIDVITLESKLKVSKGTVINAVSDSHRS